MQETKSPSSGGELDVVTDLRAPQKIGDIEAGASEYDARLDPILR